MGMVVAVEWKSCKCQVQLMAGRASRSCRFGSKGTLRRVFSLTCELPPRDPYHHAWPQRAAKAADVSKPYKRTKLRNNEFQFKPLKSMLGGSLTEKVGSTVGAYWVVGR